MGEKNCHRKKISGGKDINKNVYLGQQNSKYATEYNNISINTDETPDQ